jgi:hypothetical protein
MLFSYSLDKSTATQNLSNASALPECELLKIEKWVDDGAPDN